MVKSFGWFTIRTYVDESPNRKLLTTTLHFLCNIQICSLCGRLFEWQLRPKLKQGKQIKFLRQAVSISDEIVPLSNFIRQGVPLSRELVPLEYNYQTRCLEVFILLNSSLRQPVTILGELAPHERFSQTSGVNNYLKIYLQTVGFQDERKIMTALVVYPFMVSPAFYGWSFLIWNSP